MPAPLPPDAQIRLDAGLVRLLSEADHALGRLDGSVYTLPNADLFVLMYVRKEAIQSSQIEGTQSSLQDLLAAEAALYDATIPRDVDKIINSARAMKHRLARLGELPVAVRLIEEIHTELLRGVRGGWLQPGRSPATAFPLRPASAPQRSFHSSSIVSPLPNGSSIHPPTPTSNSAFRASRGRSSQADGRAASEDASPIGGGAGRRQ